MYVVLCISTYTSSATTMKNAQYKIHVIIILLFLLLIIIIIIIYSIIDQIFVFLLGAFVFVLIN